MKEFVEDNLLQRRRCVEADDPQELSALIRDLRQEWHKERTMNNQWHPGPETIDDWKREELKNTKKLVFPDLPDVVNPGTYESIFRPFMQTGRLRSLHIDDYEGFIASIANTEKYRLTSRLPGSAQYPVPEPKIPDFPDYRQDFTLREIPPVPEKQKPVKWHEYLFFGKFSEEHKRALDKYSKAKPIIEAFNAWLKTMHADRRLYYDHRKNEFTKGANAILEIWRKRKDYWETAVQADIARYAELCSGYESGNPDRIAEYFRTTLGFVPLLPGCEREYDIKFSDEECLLLVDLKLPYVKDMTVMKNRALVSGTRVIQANQRETKEIIAKLPFLILMRMIWEIPYVDYQRKVKLIACNGCVVYEDPATGRARRDIILTILVKPEDLGQIRLEKADPEACFRGFKGIAAARVLEMVPVQPLIKFDKNDSRFIRAEDVIDHLGDQNLATMDWKDFEHLIRELFEKEFGETGAEVKVTQASRDRGVDAIAFDPDPIRGGKFVIQAKRYTNVVEVSAVRDLYGTVLNEGANRGILVTTSNYGRDAYEFAKDKPITLLNGANLSHMLERHGYHVRIDIEEAKRLMNSD